MSEKKRLIKITEQQLREMETFSYLTNGDVPKNGGQSIVSADGKLDDEEYGNPQTTGNVAGDLGAPNAYNRHYDMNYAGRRAFIKEENQDKDRNGVDDYFELNNELDLLNDNNPGDDITRVPESILHKMNIFIDEVKRQNLTPRKQAILLSKVISSFDLKQLPPAIKKNLRLLIN